MFFIFIVALVRIDRKNEQVQVYLERITILEHLLKMDIGSKSNIEENFITK